MSELSSRFRIHLLLLPVVVGIFILTAVTHYGYTPDDTYIYLRYAHNLIHGDGVSFNPGDPSYGVTSPLWLFLISLGGMTGAGLESVAKVLDLVFAGGALVVVSVFAFDLYRNEIAALIATIGFSFNVWFIRWSGSGMETSLSVFCVCFLFWLFWHGRYISGAVVAGLLTLVRPEAFLLTVILFVCALVDTKNRKLVLLMISAYAVILLPWILYAGFTFGRIIPNTALAKAGLVPDAAGSYATLVDCFRTLGLVDGILLLMLAGGVVVMILRKLPVTKGGSENIGRFLFPALAWILLLPLLYIVTSANVVSRYFLLLSPIIVLATFGIWYSILSRKGRIMPSLLPLLSLAALLLVQNQIVYHTIVRPGIDEFEAGMKSCLIPIGEWLKQNTPPGSVVMVQDIGAIGYYSDRTICDASGLVSPAILSLLRNGYDAERLMKDRIYRSEYCHADYVVYRSFSDHDPVVPGDCEKVLTLPFSKMGLAETRINYYTVYKVR